MNKLILAVLAAALCAGPARADDAAKAKSPLDSAMTWFKHLKEGLSDSAVRGRFQHRHASAVAAVRGEEQDGVDADKPAWKLGKGGKAEKKERAELSSAVDLVLAGKLDEGKAALDAFEKAHPKSKLLSDVAQAREQIGAIESQKAQAKSAEPKSAEASNVPPGAPAAQPAPAKP